jgi:hypothetical protein
MVKLDLFPGGGGMAGRAIAGKMARWFDIGVASFALVRRTRKPALCMTGFAIQAGMLSCQWEKGMPGTTAAGQE